MLLHQLAITLLLRKTFSLVSFRCCGRILTHNSDIVKYPCVVVFPVCWKKFQFWGLGSGVRFPLPPAFYQFWFGRFHSNFLVNLNTHWSQHPDQIKISAPFQSSFEYSHAWVLLHCSQGRFFILSSFVLLWEYFSTYSWQSQAWEWFPTPTLAGFSRWCIPRLQTPHLLP